MRKLKFIRFHYSFRLNGKFFKTGNLVFECKFGTNLKEEEEFLRNFLIDGEWFDADSLNIPSLDISEQEDWHEFSHLEFCEPPNWEIKYPKWEIFCDLLSNQEYDTYMVKLEL